MERRDVIQWYNRVGSNHPVFFQFKAGGNVWATKHPHNSDRGFLFEGKTGLVHQQTYLDGELKESKTVGVHHYDLEAA